MGSGPVQWKVGPLSLTTSLRLGWNFLVEFFYSFTTLLIIAEPRKICIHLAYNKLFTCNAKQEPMHGAILAAIVSGVKISSIRSQLNSGFL